MKVVWSVRAQRDLGAIAGYIARDNPLAAERVVTKIAEAGASLATMPRRGRLSRLKAGRELILVSLPYIIEYVVGTEQIYILRVRHGAQSP